MSGWSARGLAKRAETANLALGDFVAPVCGKGASKKYVQGERGASAGQG